MRLVSSQVSSHSGSPNAIETHDAGREEGPGKRFGVKVFGHREGAPDFDRGGGAAGIVFRDGEGDSVKGRGLGRLGVEQCGTRFDPTDLVACLGAVPIVFEPEAVHGGGAVGAFGVVGGTEAGGELVENGVGVIEAAGRFGSGLPGAGEVGEGHGDDGGGKGQQGGGEHQLNQGEAGTGVGGEGLAHGDSRRARSLV